jgi:replication factor A1
LNVYKLKTSKKTYKMTKISELKPKQGNINVEGTIKEIGEERTFNKYGRELRVVNAVLEDDSGSIKLALWNEDCNRFKEGDKVKVVNGYVTEFQGEMQLTGGKFGKIELAGEGEAAEETAEEAESKEEPKEVAEEVAKVKSEGDEVQADYIDGTR